MAEVEDKEKQPYVEATAETKTDSPMSPNPEEKNKLDINENAKKTDSAENGVKGGEEDLREQTASQDEKNDNQRGMHDTKNESEKKESSSLKNKIQHAKECFIIKTGNTCNSHEEFVKRLEKYRKIIRITDKTKKYKFILVFCPVVSRAGTDIEAAMRQLNEVSATNPAVLVVLHCTNDPECVVPDSSRAVTRDNMVTADCLFHEDKGLYKCKKNDNAVKNVIAWLKTKPWRNSKGANPAT